MRIACVICDLGPLFVTVMAGQERLWRTLARLGHAT
jgi:hypothetical protein